MTMTAAVQLLVSDWRNRLTDADYQTQDGLTYSFTLIEALNSLDPNEPDFTEVSFGLDQLVQLENGGGFNEGVPFGDEPVLGLVEEIKDTISVMETGVIPSGVV